MTEPLNTSKYPFPHTAVLISHPDTSNQAVRRIEAQVSWYPERMLSLSYTLTGDCTHLRISPPQPPARANNLWQHTCFEAFIALPGGPAYQEWNFSPSGEWAVYHFRSYRDRLPLKDNEPTPVLCVHQTQERFSLDARICLSPQLTVQPLQLALSAVIEDDRGNLSYWALTHPPGKPDFHHQDAFVLKVASWNGETTRKEIQ